MRPVTPDQLSHNLVLVRRPSLLEAIRLRIERRAPLARTVAIAQKAVPGSAQS
jgi:hypothetical protein